MAPTVPIDPIGREELDKCWLSSQPMGKSRKYSKGHSYGFVPDYRHAVETVGESEGFGSSGRVDNEMTVSEDSYAPKRKCIRMNNDFGDTYSVPMQVLSLSKMSKSERKSLELRLRRELEQVRLLHRKLASFSSNADVLSPSSNIRSSCDGLKRPPLEGLHRSYEVLAPQSKKRGPAAHNGVRTKKNSHVRTEPAVTSNAMPMKQCEMLLSRLMTHQYAWVFNEPVDVVKLEIPDYFTVIKHPMDLGTVKSRIDSGAYSGPPEFAADVRLTFANAMKYNPPDNDVHFMAQTLSKYFEVRWKAIEKKLPAIINVESVGPRAAVAVETLTNFDSFPAKMKKTSENDSMVKLEPVRKVMTNEEKHKLSSELEALLAELPENIIDFLKEHSHNGDQSGEDEIEIDIDALSDDTLFKLRKLLDEFLLEKQRKQVKAEQCEVELLNESGLSTSSLQPRKGNEPADEVIDVGGNDPTVSFYPPVEIEKDAAHKSNKCSSSSSSSSESGSSSDDSSSSSSESDAARAPIPCATKEKKESEETLDEKKGDLCDIDIGNHTNGLAKTESNSDGAPITLDRDERQEGENALLDRQISPDKLYRAAILRNRFADTILKAREKALEKGEKRDPEKSRMEREELERRQKEEKARLQAEAKAAEEAQRKAAAEAAAEARRQREQEREAARQALQQMEKTVDINENSHFMDDLKMLRAVHDEELPSFMEETSEDFMLQGGNPLEQLGLYIKKDDEEEEDVEPALKFSESVKDVEEGEID